jgi:REP element-mobilizing transposase RayT
MKQLVLSEELKKRYEHGGEACLGKRKERRPVTTRQPMHVTLRSSVARGEWSFLHPKHAPFIRGELTRLAKRFHVVLYETSNVGNHLHLLLRPKTRDSLKRFLSALSGRISQHITGARRGKPFGKRFFDFIPHSRLVAWGRDLINTRGYVLQNTLEAMGRIPHRPRGRRVPRANRDQLGVNLNSTPSSQ